MRPRWPISLGFVYMEMISNLLFLYSWRGTVWQGYGAFKFAFFNVNPFLFCRVERLKVKYIQY